MTKNYYTFNIYVESAQDMIDDNVSNNKSYTCHCSCSCIPFAFWGNCIKKIFKTNNSNNSHDNINNVDNINEIMYRDISQNRNIHHGIIQNDIIQNDVIQNDVIHDDNVQNDVIQKDIINDDNVQNDIIQNDIIQSDVIHPDINGSIITQPIIMTENDIMKQNDTIQPHTVIPDLVFEEHYTNDSIIYDDKHNDKHNDKHKDRQDVTQDVTHNNNINTDTNTATKLDISHMNVGMSLLDKSRKSKKKSKHKKHIKKSRLESKDTKEPIEESDDLSGIYKILYDNIMVLRELKYGEKLCVNEKGEISVDNSYIPSLSRTLSGNGKRTTLERVEETIKTAILIRKKNRIIRKVLDDRLKHGIMNLSHTYEAYPEISRRLKDIANSI